MSTESSYEKGYQQGYNHGYSIAMTKASRMMGELFAKRLEEESKKEDVYTDRHNTDITK